MNTPFFIFGDKKNIFVLQLAILCDTLRYIFI